MVIITLASSTTIKENAQGFFYQYTQNKAKDIATFFSEEKGYVESFSIYPEIISLKWDTILPTLLDIKSNSSTIDSFLLVRGNGSYFRSDNLGNPAHEGLVTPDNSDPNSKPISLTTRDYFQRLIVQNTLSLKHTVLSSPNLSKSTGKKQIVMATNIHNSNGISCGLFAVTITGEVIEHAVNTVSNDLEKQFGTQGNLFLLSDDGAIVSHIKYDREEKRYSEQILSKAETTDILSLPETLTSTITGMLKEKSSITTYRDDMKKVWHVAKETVPGTNYYVLFALPENSLYSAILTIWQSLFIISGLTLVVVIFISMLIGKRITKPLVETANTLKNISQGSGDLTYRISVEGKDEVSDVGKHFNSFMETLHAMITDVKKNTSTMDGLSQDLSSRATNINTDIGVISSSVTDLNSQTEEQSASITETSSTIHQIAKNIESLTQQIEGQTAGVTESSAAVQQMVSNINSITNNLNRAGSGFEELLSASSTGRESMQNVRELIKNVSNQSAHLLETNEIVDAIASQTNLLAMNAAIEAAHAGEAGKGFSVVSDEIRKLAENSSEQSKVIETELKQVVNTIETIVAASAKADDAFGSVAKQIVEANGLVQEIRLAMKEQNEGGRQVLEALNEIQNITVQIRDGSLEMNQGADMILKEMTRLEDVSLQVQRSTQEIGRSSDAITLAIEEITSVTVRNSGAVDSLKDIAGKFTT
ncbi:MAG TPA: HAMP domain-containing protein [Treponema sp.]|nr:HAMP domain-containing protein [Treponema sp.]